MTNADRIALIREKLSPCQVALRKLGDAMWLGKELPMLLAKLEEKFLDLEAATGCVCTPAALFDVD